MLFEEGRFEALRERLLKGGIAPRRVRRYLAELEDHLIELTRCEEDAGYDPETAAIRARALLGDDALLAEAMLAQPKLRSLTARAPWAFFVLAVPFAVVLAFVIPTLTLVHIGKIHGVMTHNAVAAPLWFRYFALSLTGVSNLSLGPALAILMLLAAHRQRLNPKWPLIGTLIVALIAMHMQVEFPSPGKHGGSLSLSAFFPMGSGSAHFYRAHAALMLAQLILTLSPLAWLIFPRRPRTA